MFLLTLFAARTEAADRQLIHHPLPVAATNAAPLRRSSPWARLNLTIGLPLRDREGLTNLLEQLYDPASPNFRHYLTPEQFTERFGPTTEDYQAVLDFAKSRGLIVTGQHPNRTLVNVRGTVSSVERAFHVRLHEYQHPTESRTYFAPDAEPSIDLATPVLTVSGIDNYIVPHPCYHSVSTNQPKAQATGSGPGATYLGNDFRSAYLPGVTMTGSGQTIGILEFDSGFYQSDITAYESLAGLPNVPVNAVLLDGYTGGPGMENVEVSVDIEMAISMAPGLSSILVYEGSTTDDILNRMATDNQAKQIAASWTYQVDANSDQIFLQMAAQGQSYFNASGDGDAYTGTISPPADDPNITVVGGTTLTTASTGGPWQSETVWNAGGGEGSAGGISTRFTIPSWQKGISMTANQGSTTMRNVPDVSLTADNIYVMFGGGQTEVGAGTSCSVQLWAALNALMNELAVTNGEATVGFVNPALYAVGKGANYGNFFHDTTNGNNEKASSPNKFVAVQGYDLCTGLGTPNSGIITAIGLPEPLEISPLAPLIFSGPVGGPFLPASQTFSLTNFGPGSLNWSLANMAPWLDVTPASGAAVGGAPSDIVTVSVSSSATNMSAGSYSSALRFTNLGDKFGQTRVVTLAVVTTPVITGQPTNQSALGGMTAKFSVQTASNALISYQWQDAGINLRESGIYSGTTTGTLTISNISGPDAGSYSVILSNAAGMVKSSNAVLTFVHSGPVVVQQPANQSALPGAMATFTVGAVGDTPYKYQWKFNGTNLVNNATYSGATSKILTVTNVSQSDVGTYSVNVGNFQWTTNSAGATLTVVPITAAGLSVAPLVSFDGAANGGAPYSPIAQAADGNFYGTTTEQGANSDGTVFRFSANGTLTTLLSFAENNGAIPYAGLTQGKDGLLYGGAATGGTYEDGTAFKISTGGTLTTLTTFNGNNGSEPVAALVQGSDSNFYGTALEGGAYGFGTIFRVNSTGTLTTLVSLNDIDGANSSSALIQGSDGNFYGTTEDGGDFTWGGVFRISPSGNFTNLYSFTGGSDGGSPVPGLVQAADGNYYGTTYLQGDHGYGTVFEITPSGTLTTRYSFTGGADGANPWGGLVQAADGNLYGTTQDFGSFGFGTIFRMAPTGALATVGQFDGYLGAYPSAAMIQGKDGNLYGTTLSGGLYNSGEIYRVNIGGPLQITGQPANQSGYTGGTAAFTVATFGAAPLFYQWQQNGINLTNGGGISGANFATLSISNITINDAAVYSVVVSNTINSVASDDAVLQVVVSPPTFTAQPISQTCVEGMTVTLSVTVAAGQPFSFQWRENGTNLADGGTISGSATSTLTFSNVTGANSGTYSVIVSNSLDTVASANAVLTVLPVTSPSASMTALHRFNGTQDGAFPYGGLVQGNDGNLYGTAEGGGTSFAGVIYKMTLAGSLSTVYSFSGSPNGADPVGGLFLGRNGDFYGTSADGGVNNDGAVFRLIPSPVTVKVLYSFQDADDGAIPADTLVEGADGNFYGTTYLGGASGYGSVFKMAASGALTSLYGFSGGDDGGNPYAGLIQGNDGNFYGTTLQFGAYGFGTAFRVSPTGTFDTLISFNETNGAFPQGGVIQGPDGLLYGTTFDGGSNGFGTVFSLTTNGTLTTLLAFNSTNGSNPAASLLQASDGNFYGTTSAGGAGGQGTAFRLTTNGALTTLLWFNGLNGADPESPLIQARDGNFYGTTAQGGTGFNPTAGGGNGAMFRLTVPIFVSNSITATTAVATLNYVYNISPFALAPTDDALTFAIVSGPAWLAVAPHGFLHGTPAVSDIGTNICVISLTDSNGLSATVNVIIPVIQDPPPAFIVNPFAEPWANVNMAYSGTIATNATNPEISDGDVLGFAKISGPAWLILAPNGTLSGTAGLTNAGENDFEVSVFNIGGASNTAAMSLYVNSAPSFLLTTFTAPTASAGIAYSGTISANATDADISAGDSLSFSKINGPAWLNVAPDGGLSGTPASTNLGKNVFQVGVTDSGGLTATANLTITVNTAPPPAIAVQISLQGTNVLLSWTGGSAPYQVRMTIDLSHPVWQNVGAPSSSTSLALSPTNVSSYYQIVGQ
jgi:uncharacterized repeat protein (TIGR03803 family)